METKTNSGDSTLLIDFSSPISKRTLHTPLIPVPNDVNCMSVSPSNTNPFDVVVKQTISSESLDNDPFECASKTTPTNLNTTERVKNSQEEHLQIKVHTKYLRDNVNTQQETMTEINIQNCDNKFDMEQENTSDLFNIPTIDKEVEVPGLESKTNNLLHICDDNSLSQVSGDFSTEEGIKATIARRVNKCIQKVLSDSILKKNTDNKQCTGFHKCRKSSSFTTTTTSNQACDRLNKSCSERVSIDDSFIVANHNQNTPESSICSCDLTPSSFMSREDLLNESINPKTENDVFQEANKLARRFSRIAESFSKNADEADNDDDDLLSCKPQWLYADSSEDEDEKLKKDPALNIRVSFTSSKPTDQPDSDALSAFKTRTRRSFSHLQQANDSQNENSIKRSISIGSKLTIVPVAPTIVSTSVPIILEKQNDNLLKLKKKPLGELRKGPMRAVMPVQIMAKESLASGVQSARNRATSPIKKKSSSQIMISPIKDVSQLNMCPVASSTPNKCSSATSYIMTPQSARHSFGSTADKRQSRNPLVDSGTRQRSSSANSSIPTAVVLPGRTLGPKSKSNLVKSSNTPKISPHHDKDSEKNPIKPTGLKPSFNPKALNEVKPRTSRVKNTVNAISNVFTGKNKKTAVRDKENRIPA